MKRTLSLVLVLALLFALFCAPVASAEAIVPKAGNLQAVATLDEIELSPKASYAGYSLSRLSKGTVSVIPGSSFTVKVKANKPSLYNYLQMGFTKGDSIVLVKGSLSSDQKTWTGTFRVVGQPGTNLKLGFFVETTSGRQITLASVTVKIKSVSVSSISMTKKKTLYVDSTGYCPTYQLLPTVKPFNATNPALTFSSSKSSVASVNKYTGEVTAKKKGTAKITVKSSNGKKATCTITVKSTKIRYEQEDKTEYRALMISNTWYKYAGDLLGDMETTQALANAFKNCSYDGQKFSNIRILADQTGDQMRAALNGLSTSWGIDENDVTVFYYSGHGSNAGGYNSYLCGTDCSSGSMAGFVSVADVQAALSKVPGKVYVILDACHSGGFISKNGESSGSTEDFLAGALRPFQLASKDLRQSKFHVLAAAAHDQYSLSMGNYGTGVFFSQTTRWLALMGGYDMMNKAVGELWDLDSPSDGEVSFYEAWFGVDALCKDESNNAPDMKMWPENDRTALFARN